MEERKAEREMRNFQHRNLPFDFESNSLETLMKIVDKEVDIGFAAGLATVGS